MSVVKPILRIFDEIKTIEFYIDWLGFQIDWKSGATNEPKYMQISLQDIVLHLSEHHGDGTPGTRVFIDEFTGLANFHRTLTQKNYKYNKPGLERFYFDQQALHMQVDDPFGNKLIFVERGVAAGIQ
jgi:hypothetical protein